METTDHILVVDDDRDIRELIVDYLVKSGYRATGAANGKEMRAVLDRQAVDMVVLDIMSRGTMASRFVASCAAVNIRICRF